MTLGEPSDYLYKSMRIFNSIILILMAHLVLLSQQKSSIKIEFFQTKSGISNKWVNSIAEDKNGILWVGTRDGLNIYSGGNFSTLRHNLKDTNSLTLNDISAVFATSTGDIVVGTWGKGINLVNPLTKAITHPSNKYLNESLTVKSIAEAEKGSFYIATNGNGVYRYDIDNDRFTKCISKFGDGTSFDFCESLHLFDEKVWVASRTGGLAYLDTEKNEIIPCDILNNYDSENSFEVTSLSDDGSNLLVGTQYGMLFSINVRNNTVQLLKKFEYPVRVMCMSSNKSGVIWISTSHGFFEYTDSLKTLTELISVHENKAFDNNFTSFVDSRGILWLGTWGKGLGLFNPYKQRFNYLNFHDLNVGNNRTYFELGDNSLLIGGDAGLFKYTTNYSSDNKVSMHKLMGGKIAYVTNTAIGLLVYVEQDGVYVLDDNFNPRLVNEKSQFISESLVRSILKIDSLHLLIGSKDNGLAELNLETGELNDNFPEDLKGVNCLFKDASGVVWVGTNNGLFHYIPSSGSLVNANFSNGELDQIEYLTVTRQITQDINGDLWISTKNGLLLYSNLLQEFVELPAYDINLQLIFYNLIPYDNYIWGTSRVGLVKIDVNSLTTEIYTEEEGLLSNSFHREGALVSQSGQVYIGNRNHTVHFLPKPDTLSHYGTKFFIEDFFVNGKRIDSSSLSSHHISVSDSVFLSYGENNIAFNLTKVCYNEFLTESIAFRLVGLEENWTTLSYHDYTAKYTNLKPGNYVFEVVSVNGEQIIDGSIQQIHIVIDQPIWRTWWFITISIFTVLLTVIIIFVVRNKALKNQRDRLEKRVVLRTQEIRNQNKKLYNQQISMNSNVTYASILQQSMLSNDAQIENAFSDYFVYYQPKELIGGDFYWCTKIGNISVFVAADCTGHGVSGAFLSILGISSLKSIISHDNIDTPNVILDELHTIVSEAFSHDKRIHDGMEISIICYNNVSKELKVASTMKSVLLVSENTPLLRLRGDRKPIGGDSQVYKNNKPYSCQSFEIKESTMVYLFSDGYQDQFGGGYQKKFSSYKFRELLNSINMFSMSYQKKVLEETFNDWKHDLDQIDDVMVIGIKLS